MKLEKITLQFTVSVGKEGKVFGSVSTKQITEELQKKYKITVDKKKFVDNGPFNELGIHKVKVELYKGVIGEVKINLTGK